MSKVPITFTKSLMQKFSCEFIHKWNHIRFVFFDFFDCIVVSCFMKKFYLEIVTLAVYLNRLEESCFMNNFYLEIVTLAVYLNRK